MTAVVAAVTRVAMGVVEIKLLEVAVVSAVVAAVVIALATAASASAFNSGSICGGRPWEEERVYLVAKY